eukprot:TRINITY_DN58872_c0_g1_i1.p1 TRINITY_DN58872_c0_g1~~TRINITY_DN58872_c0_g1_i1.p1  ORF type:complete len:759 (+),score=97.09 TRINITY_DN58872_c0_g1_i1:51-2279(+)
MSLEDSDQVPDAPDHIANLRRWFPFKRYIALTENRGITPRQLQEIERFAVEHCSRWWCIPHSPSAGSPPPPSPLSMDELNLYHLCQWLIKPATKESNCAFVELQAWEDQPPAWFVSHWWGERIKDFLACVLHHAEVRCLGKNRALWVCAYANRQHSLNEELATDPLNTSFFRATRIAMGVLLILDATATPFTRIWCAFEEAVAVNDRDRGTCKRLLLDIVSCDKGVASVLTDGPAKVDEIVQFEYMADQFGSVGSRASADAPWIGLINKARREKGFPIEIMRKGLECEVQLAQASIEADRRSILNTITHRKLDLTPLETHENYDKVNNQLRAIFALSCWRQLVERDPCLPQEWGLQGVLAADSERTEVSLDFYQCAAMGDEGVRAVASGIAANLKVIRLNFGGTKITDAGVAAISAKLPANLEKLNVFLPETCITDACADMLTMGLPAGLQELLFSFRQTQLTNAGISTLMASGLPQSLRKLELHFMFDAQISDAGALAISRHLPSCLHTLVLNFHGTSVGDVFAEDLANKLPCELEMLRLWFGCTQLGDMGVTALARHMPAGLQNLVLKMGKTRVTDVGVRAIAEGLPANLHSLHLLLQETDVTDLGLSALVANLPAVLRSLTLWLHGSGTTRDTVRDLGEQLPTSMTCLELVTKWPCAARENFYDPAQLRTWGRVAGQFRQLDVTDSWVLDEPTVLQVFHNIGCNADMKGLHKCIAASNSVRADGLIDYGELLRFIVMKS